MSWSVGESSQISQGTSERSGSCQRPSWPGSNEIERIMHRGSVGPHRIGNVAPSGTPQDEKNPIAPGGQRVSGAPAVRLAGIFPQRHITHIMIAVLDRPMP